MIILLYKINFHTFKNQCFIIFVNNSGPIDLTSDNVPTNKNKLSGLPNGTGVKRNSVNLAKSSNITHESGKIII